MSFLTRIISNARIILMPTVQEITVPEKLFSRDFNIVDSIPGNRPFQYLLSEVGMDI